MHDNNTKQKRILVITKGAVEVLLDKIDEHQPLCFIESQRSSQRRLSGYGYAIKEMRALLDPLNRGDRIFINIGFAGMILGTKQKRQFQHAYRNHPCNDYR
jgi:hypothetical protein